MLKLIKLFLINFDSVSSSWSCLFLFNRVDFGFILFFQLLFDHITDVGELVKVLGHQHLVNFISRLRRVHEDLTLFFHLDLIVVIAVVLKLFKQLFHWGVLDVRQIIQIDFLLLLIFILDHD